MAGASGTGVRGRPARGAVLAPRAARNDTRAVQTKPPPIAATAATPTRDLDRSLVRGLAWTGGGKWLVQIISWVATPIVASLLNPADYGIAGMAMVYVGLVQLVTDFGLGAAIVQRRELDEDQIAQLGGVSLLFGLAFCGVSIALAPSVARFFDNPAVEPVVIALSVLFVASGFQTVPRALLNRDLHFRRLATLDGAEALSNIAVTLPLAVMGFRHWALVVGAITGRMVSTLLALWWRRHRLRIPTRLDAIAGPLRFGAHVIGSSLAWYTFINADLTIIGRRLGSVALGSYSIAMTLASIPVDRLSALVARVSPAILAKVQHDPPALRRYVLALTEGTALLTFPAAVGLALVAREFVLVVLGEEWIAAVLPLQLLALAAVLRSVTPLFSQVLVATGNSRLTMQANLVTAAILIPLFYIGSQWGTGGVALVWLVVYPVVAAAFAMRYGFAACGMTLPLYARALWPATSATLVMAGVVLALDAAMTDRWSQLIVFLVKGAAGAATYLGLIAYLHGARLRRTLAVVRGPGNSAPSASSAVPMASSMDETRRRDSAGRDPTSPPIIGPRAPTPNGASAPRSDSARVAAPASTPGCPPRSPPG